MSNNQVIYSIDSIPVNCIDAVFLLGKFDLSCRFSLLYKKTTEVSLAADDINSEYKIKNIFSKLYTIVDRADSKNIIMCTKRWKTDIDDLNQYGITVLPFWLWLVCDKNMINYERLKQVAKEMDAEPREMLTWIKKQVKKEIICVYGNCQNISINTLITSSNILNEKYILLDMPPIQDLKEERQLGISENILKEVDIFVYQEVSSHNKFSPMLASSFILNKLNENAKTICIPNAYFTGYFPQVCDNPYNPFLKQYSNTPFPYGDENIQRMEGRYSAKEIAEIIDADNFYTAEECKNNVEESLSQLEKREENCDVKISDYITIHYKKRLLFYTPNHPTNEVLAELVKRIFMLCGVRVEDIRLEKAWENNGREIFIYPSVRKNLQLEFNKTKYCWWNVIKAEPSDIYEYVEDYLKYCSRKDVL